MEVRYAAALELDNFHVRHPRGEVMLPNQTPQRHGEAMPQLGRVPGEEHVPEVVVAVGAERLAESDVVRLVHRQAPDRDSVLTPIGCARATPPAIASCGVHRSETGRGQGGEHHRPAVEQF